MAAMEKMKTIIGLPAPKDCKTLADVFMGYMGKMRASGNFTGVDQYLMMKIMAATKPTFEEVSDYEIVASFPDGSAVRYSKPVALIMADRR